MAKSRKGKKFEPPYSVKVAALKIYDQLTEADRLYADSPERGTYRGFAALHDLMDANMILPLANSATLDLNDGGYVNWCNAIMDAVSLLIIEGYWKTIYGNRSANPRAQFEYSPYRATLRKNGEFFAFVVASDGKSAISREAARELVAALNAS